MNPRTRRTLLASLAVMALAWGVALGGFALARSARVTADKVRRFAESVDLSKLDPAARRKAILDLAAKLNALASEERRRARLDGTASRWFNAMTEEEKATFIDAAMPTGFKQMITAFEQLPQDKRRRAVGDAVKRLQEAQLADAADGNVPPAGTNAPPVLSEELQQQVVKVGLKAFYSESSAATKAEMAPFLEELQRLMESGRAFRPSRGPG